MRLEWEIDSGYLVIRLLKEDEDGEGREFTESEISIPLSKLSLPKEMGADRV